MPDKRPEVKALEAIDDPILREAEARVAIEDARELMAAVSDVRSAAMAEIARKHGPQKAARLLHISRHNVYRIMRQNETPEEKAERAARVEAAMRNAQVHLKSANEAVARMHEQAIRAQQEQIEDQ